MTRYHGIRSAFDALRFAQWGHRNVGFFLHADLFKIADLYNPLLTGQMGCKPHIAQCRRCFHKGGKTNSGTALSAPEGP